MSCCYDVLLAPGDFLSSPCKGLYGPLVGSQFQARRDYCAESLLVLENFSRAGGEFFYSDKAQSKKYNLLRFRNVW